MKKLLLLLCVSFTLATCGDSVDQQCGTYNGHTLYKGPKGGCYYKNSNGNKEYVDRNLCNC